MRMRRLVGTRRWSPFPCGATLRARAAARLLQLKRPCPFCSAPIKNTDLDRLPEAWRMA